MVDQVSQLFDICPDYDLNIMQQDQSLSQITANVLSRFESVVIKEKPDWILVQGDTTTVMAAALVAFYHRVKLGHVEAGLRTWDKFQPYPEEINRKIAGSISDLHFAPTETARNNLLREGVADASIRVTGNTGIDALHWVASRPMPSEVYSLLRGLGLNGNGISPRVILVTAHRRENFGEPLENICNALKDIATKRSDVRIIYPVHLNPNVRRVVYKVLSGVPNVTLLDPLDYFPMVQLMKHAYMVLTDSGGLQEEAPGLGKPVLVLREATERPEGVEAGTARVIGTDRVRVAEEIVELLDNAEKYGRMAQAINPYGDGNAAERIVAALMEYR